MCEHCSETQCESNLIGVYDPRYIAMIPNHICCPMCDGMSQIKLDDWHNPRPCAVCQGTGQLNEKLLPSPLTQVRMILGAI